MIAETIHRNVERSGELVEGDFTIKASAGIYAILRDHLYSDKHLAIVREIGCNARDAHVASGQPDRPIEIFVPTSLEPVIKFRDFGNGLSRQQMFEVFCVYGESSKRDSNDQIGYFGIGAKSPFCMSSSFQIVSIHNNVKSVYSAYLDETDCGKLAILAEDECFGEETGLEISIPVKNNDIYYYQKTIREFFRFWKIKPILKNYPLDIENAYFEGVYKKTGRHNSSCVVMGGIPYELDSDKLNGFTSNEISIIKHGIAFNANIGDIAISASRETVAYVPKTFAFLKKAISEIREENKLKVAELIGNITSEYSARFAYNQIFDNQFLKDVLGDSIGGLKVEYSGRVITSRLFSTPFPFSYSYKGSRRFQTYEDTVNVDLIGAEGNWYYLNISNLSQSKITRYNREICKSVGNRHIVAKITDIKQLKDYCDATGLEFDKFQDLTKRITLVNPVRAKSNIGPSDYIKIDVEHRNVVTCCGEIADIPVDSIYFIRSGKKFLLPSNGQEIDIRYVAGIIQTLKLKKHTHIYGIKKRDMEEADETLQNGEEFLKEQFEKFDQKTNFTFDRYHICSWFFTIKNLVKNAELTDLVSKYVYGSDEILYNNFSMIGHSSANYRKAKSDIADRWQKILNKIPMFFVVEDGKRTDQVVIDYLKEKLED